MITEPKMPDSNGLIVHIERSQFDGMNEDGTPPVIYTRNEDGTFSIKEIRLIGWKCVGPVKNALATPTVKKMFDAIAAALSKEQGK